MESLYICLMMDGGVIRILPRDFTAHPPAQVYVHQQGSLGTRWGVWQSPVTSFLSDMHLLDMLMLCQRGYCHSMGLCRERSTDRPCSTRDLPPAQLTRRHCQVNSKPSHVGSPWCVAHEKINHNKHMLFLFQKVILKGEENALQICGIGYYVLDM